VARWLARQRDAFNCHACRAAFPPSFRTPSVVLSVASPPTGAHERQALSAAAAVNVNRFI